SKFVMVSTDKAVNPP
ncbi:hypothetical protein, partial [Mammaliicoccus lentus]